MARARVSILIPVYNEAPYVEAVLDAVRTAPLPAGLEREVVCVNDGSSDDTRAILDRYLGRVDTERFLAYHDVNRQTSAAA